ncbi:DNA polymerase IV [Treponema sp. OttesenSCG-928-L16]|nr:DNA polymerase IV [Treponema sp. OttesenSCG-928-L16]
MGRIIIHVDMDAFYAAVEIRDKPELAGKPLIIGALPDERGVVSTCSYEAREYGVHSAMSIKEAYRLCPQGIYMHPDMQKYKEASDKIHEIWSTYTDLVEYISLDEGYLDVSGSAHLFGGPRNIGQEIKGRTKDKLGLSCSVGVGFTMMSAKLASEEKKPDGYFEIPDPQALKALIIDRPVKVLFGVGAKTAAALEGAGFYTVRDIYENRQGVIRLFGSHGKEILALADGIDERGVRPFSEPKSIGKEHTFQKDITDFEFLKDTLRLTAKELSFETHQKHIYSGTVTLKITYSNMKAVTRSKTGSPTNRADEIYRTAASLLDTIEKRPVRLIGISLSKLTKNPMRQTSLMDMDDDGRKKKLEAVTFQLQQRFGKDVIETGNELHAKKRFSENGG